MCPIGGHVRAGVFTICMHMDNTRVLGTFTIAWTKRSCETNEARAARLLEKNGDLDAFLRLTEPATIKKIEN